MPSEFAGGWKRQEEEVIVLLHVSKGHVVALSGDDGSNVNGRCGLFGSVD